MPAKKSDLRAHLAALVDGTAPQPANMPSAETYDLSHAVAACAANSLGRGELGDEVFPLDALPAPSALLPPLP